MIRKASHHMTALPTRPLASRVVAAVRRLFAEPWAGWVDPFEHRAPAVCTYCEACGYRLHFGKCSTKTDLPNTATIYY